MRDMFEEHGDACFALADECRNCSDLIREEWETRLVRNPGADPVKAGQEMDGDTAEKAQELEEPEDPDRSPFCLMWSADSKAGWLPENPLGVPSEREVYVAQIKAIVYRVMLVRL